MNELKGLQSQQVAERAAAAEALSQLGEEAASAAVPLVRCCDDDESVAQWAVAALESLGPPPEDSIAELENLTKSEHALVAYWAITLIGRCGETALSCQQTLAKILHEESNEISVRQRAAWALGEIQAESKEAIAALGEASKAADARLARLASQSLASVKSRA
jgi:HEAT repeat protein